ncbi:exported hypothetical protein [Capnocytophaga canimorsus]|nr:hypothetical protein [Capnocytophaga canimorsus]CEN43544.1 exported hypothetical protein [Capnocytophaga canimorsus]
MKNIIKWGLAILIGVASVSCIKNEPLDIAGSYTDKLTKEAKEKEAKEKEAQTKADEENNKAWEAYYKNAS